METEGFSDPTPTPTPTQTPTPTFVNNYYFNTHSVHTNQSGIYAQPTRKSGDMTFMFWFKFTEKKYIGIWFFVLVLDQNQPI